MHLRPVLLPLCAALVLAGVASPAASQEALRGTIRCGLIPGLTTKPLLQEFAIDIAGNQARYTRPVYRADTRIPSGITESGAGAIGPDGSLTLTGGAAARTFKYTATYAGRLPPPGGTARFAGYQQWSAEGVPSTRRDCTIDVQR